MDIFRTVTQSVLGSQQSGNQPSGAETVERLLDRVQSSTLLEDRRDGCRALKALSKKYRLLVGAHGMDTMIQVLESDRNDHEIVNYALETLVNVTSDEIFLEEAEEGENPDALENAQIGEQFTEIFTKRTENIGLLMSLLDEFDFKVRYSSMKLLKNLLKNRSKELQESILITPNGVSKLMDMLSDSREIIRNDTLLLLTQLTKGNTNLQKIVVFENAFDHLFDIIKEEGFSEGGVVVEDCLTLMLNLLKNNPSNQTLFKEGNFIQRITNFFELPLDNDAVGWPAQKVANVHYMLKLVRTLVAPQNSAQVVSACQKKMNTCGLLEKLCTLLMAVGVPADILSDTIITVSELIRGCQENQEYFSNVTAPSTPPRPAIVVLLMSMVNDKQPFILRCAVLYCFQCFLYKNPTSQAQIVQTLLPQTADANQITAGQLLCGGLFANDAISNWFSAIALSHALMDNTVQKEQLLRVQLATGVGTPPVSLLQQCTSLLQGGAKLPTRLGVLQLICTWLAHCPIAVTHLLSLPGVINHIAAYLSANEQDETEVICQGVYAFLLGLCGHFNDGSVSSLTREALVQLISNRVGVETYTDKIENILRSEAYNKAAKATQINAKQPLEVIFDHEFTKLFKSLEGSILRSVTPQVNGSGEEIPTAEMLRYKHIISDQNAEIASLTTTLEQHQLQLATLSSDNLSLIEKAKKSESKQQSSAETNGVTQTDKVSHLEQQLSEMIYARDYYYYQMVEKDTQLQAQTSQNQTGNDGTNGVSANPELDTLRKQLDDLQLVLYKKDEQLLSLSSNNDSPVATDSLTIKKLQEEKRSLESSFSDLLKDKSLLEVRLKDAEMKLEEKDNEITRLMSSDALIKYPRLQDEYNRLQNEQEDLLVLLTDQETKISEMKRSLRSFGEIFSDDQDDDDSDQDIDFDDSADDDLNLLT